MKNALYKLFHLQENNTKIRTEIIGGVITFISMVYILPLNASILSSMGMSSTGVFAVTAIVSCIVTLIMGLVANYPIVLSTGMGLNAFLAYTLTDALGFHSWQQKMIVLTITGIIYFIFSLTPLRKKLVEAIPKDMKNVISACLGGFIAFVGLKGSNIVVSSPSTLVTMGNLADPAMLISFIAIFLCMGLMFTKNRILSLLAIPVSIMFAAFVGVITSSLMFVNGAITQVDGEFVYSTGNAIIDSCPMNLPLAIEISKPNWGASGIKDVFMYGLLTDSYDGAKFGADLGYIFTVPATYVAIFSLMFVKLFDSTATLIAVGEKTGMIADDGTMKNYRCATLADATGTLICAPLGTSAVSPFAESNIGIALGAKTGLSACVSALLFLAATFCYPIFSFFTASSVTAAALMCVGSIIVVGAFKNLSKDDQIMPFVAVIGILFAVLTYSIANGIGVAFIAYTSAMLIANRRKEIPLAIYIITALYILSFVLNTLITLM